MARWLLPEAIADILPADARSIETLRQRLLELCRRFGYELVQPPLIEYIESLLTGSGSDLDLRTFKLIDQLSGRTLGLRPDMTPQVARIDAHLLDRAGVTRLCYCGSVLHTQPAGLYATREPIHLGGEIYGHGGLEADLEAIDLMLTALELAGVKQVHLDLGHVGLVRALLPGDRRLTEDDVFPLLAARDVPALRERLDGADAQTRDALIGLARTHQAPAALAQVRQDWQAVARFLPPTPAVQQGCSELTRLLDSPILQRHRALSVSVDLSGVRGYRYHSGITFEAYVPGEPNSIARGGRYDNVGATFGRARAATGFSLELRSLAALLPQPKPAPAILAPWSDQPSLLARIARLRADGEVVVQQLPGHEQEQQEFDCDRELVRDNNDWVVRALKV